MRRRFQFGAAALLGASVVVLPAVAGSETSPTITAENIGGGIYGEEHRWTPAQATIAPGGTVTLSNPTEVKHGVRWIGGPATPSCDSGVPVGTTEAASNTKWSGSCTFAAAGVYTFYCTVHGAAMTARVTVGSGETTTTGTQSGTTGTGTGTGTSGSSTGTPPGGSSAPGAGASGSPFLGSAARALKLAASQHGRSVRGSVGVSQAGAHGSLEVDLLVRSASLARSGHSAQVRVGRIVRSSLSAGTARFSVPLNRRAKAALKRRGRLALSVKVVLKPVGGSPVSVTRGVVLHA